MMLLELENFQSQIGILGEPSSLPRSKVDSRRQTRPTLPDAVRVLGGDAIILWIAMLLKKRVFVHSTKLSELLRFVRCCPKLHILRVQSVASVRLAPAELCTHFALSYIMRGGIKAIRQRHRWGFFRSADVLNSQELADLQSAGVYVAGFTDSSARGLSTLFDVFVDCRCR